MAKWKREKGTKAHYTDLSLSAEREGFEPKGNPLKNILKKKN